jgi:ABC-type Fe3+ transport system permease subunit
MSGLTRIEDLRTPPRGRAGARTGWLAFGIGLLLLLIGLASAFLLPREPVRRLEHSLTPIETRAPEGP